MFCLICAWIIGFSKQSWGWWFEMPSSSLWRHCDFFFFFSAPFICDDGEEIPGEWECDWYADCSDGSDEINCEAGEWRILKSGFWLAGSTTANQLGFSHGAKWATKQFNISFTAGPPWLLIGRCLFCRSGILKHSFRLAGDKLPVPANQKPVLKVYVKYHWFSLRMEWAVKQANIYLASDWLAAALKRKCCHFDEILFTDCTESCHFDNFRCSQWWKFRQNDDISVSVCAANQSETGFENFILTHFSNIYIITVDKCLCW